MCVSCLSYTVAGFLQPLSLVQFLKFPQCRSIKLQRLSILFLPRLFIATMHNYISERMMQLLAKATFYPTGSHCRMKGNIMLRLPLHRTKSVQFPHKMFYWLSSAA